MAQGLSFDVYPNGASTYVYIVVRRLMAMGRGSNRGACIKGRSKGDNTLHGGGTVTAAYDEMGVVLIPLLVILSVVFFKA